MGECLHIVQQLLKVRPVDLHGGVGAVEDDAMLVIVDVGAVLERPVLAVEGDGDDPVVLPGGVIESARIAFILAAEGAAGIAALRGRLCRGDVPRVLFRLGKIDGDVQLPVGGGGLPFDIPCDAVPPDVVGIHREAIEQVGGGLSAPVGEDGRGRGGLRQHLGLHARSDRAAFRAVRLPRLPVRGDRPGEQSGAGVVAGGKSRGPAGCAPPGPDIFGYIRNSYYLCVKYNWAGRRRITDKDRAGRTAPEL